MARRLLQDIADPTARAVRSRVLAETSLVLGLLSLLLLPTFGPLTVLLGPAAWITGHTDRKRAAKAQLSPDPSAEMGRVIGKGLTLVLALAAALVALVLLVAFLGSVRVF